MDKGIFHQIHLSLYPIELYSGVCLLVGFFPNTNKQKAEKTEKLIDSFGSTREAWTQGKALPPRLEKKVNTRNDVLSEQRLTAEILKGTWIGNHELLLMN